MPNDFSETALLSAVIVGVVLGIGGFVLWIVRPAITALFFPLIGLGQ